ncbi:MAG TPA: aldo/keto reductase, partial [Candidatus Nanoarchaeia archaeon]|nr:aldo/keto reductase [Candidatus Nanoarchaeia archaeon]
SETLKQLQTDYLDLYLIHWPNNKIDMKETFKAMHELLQKGKVRNIGVSNFTVEHLEQARKLSKKISINQVEFHPYLYQKALLNYCNENKVTLTAYSPLGRGQILNDKTITEIAKKHNKSPAQICLRWLIQKDIIVIPKASSEHHLKNNLEVFDFSLKEKEMKLIDSIGIKKRMVNPGFAEFD